VSYVGWVCCWFSSLLQGFFSGYSSFPPSIKTNISKFQFDLDVKCLPISPWLGRLGDYAPHYDVKFDLSFSFTFQISSFLVVFFLFLFSALYWKIIKTILENRLSSLRQKELLIALIMCAAYPSKSLCSGILIFPYV